MTAQIKTFLIMQSTKNRARSIRHYMFNPLVPKISFLKLEGIIKNFSYLRRDNESVDEISLS